MARPKKQDSSVLTLEELTQLAQEQARQARQLRLELDLVIGTSREMLRPAEVKKLIGVKDSQLGRLRDRGCFEYTEMVHKRHDGTTTSRYLYSKRSVLRYLAVRSGDASAEALSPEDWEKREETRSYYRAKRKDAGLSPEIVEARVHP